MLMFDIKNCTLVAISTLLLLLNLQKCWRVIAAQTVYFQIVTYWIATG